MKNLLIKTNPLIYVLLIVFTFTTCKKDDSGNMTVKTGDWYGTDISFTVGGSPQKISNLEFSYSGHATGTICNFDYESTASFVYVTEIEGNAFTADINTYTISGTFMSDTTAEIEITWTIYDSNCDANYSGDRTYTASCNSLR